MKSGAETYCYGTGSCFLVDTLISDSFVLCDSGYSCSNIGLLTSGTAVYCEGSNSCQESTITAVSEVKCLGYASCNLTTITISGAGANVTCDSSYSCANSVINVNGNTGNVKILGENAGYGATINCGSSRNCTVDCNGDACYQTTLSLERVFTVLTFCLCICYLLSILFSFFFTNNDGQIELWWNMPGQL